MTDITLARAAIVDMFESLGCSDGVVGTLEPLMDGFMSRVEFDHPGDLGDTRETIRISEGETREYRRWHSVNGRVARDGWSFAFQGEWGTYGPFSDADDVLTLNVWAGRSDVPDDVSYAFGLEHDRYVAQAALVRMYVAASALRGIPDEVLAEVARIASVDGIVEQTDRLKTAR
jgi:hypothetical protein